MNSPPWSPEAEAAVIGGILLDPRTLDEAADVVSPADFYRADHRLIFTAFLAMQDERRPLDLVTTSEWLEARGQLAEAGGMAYLATMARDTPSAANVRPYAQLVREHSIRRRLIAASTDIARLANEEPDMPAALDQAQALLSGIAERGSSRSEAVSIRDAIREFCDDLDTRYERGGDLAGEPMGLADLDRALSGLQPGRLYVIAGRPGMGKSSLALQAGAEFAIRKRSVLVHTLEMPTIECVARLFSCLGRVDHGALQDARLQDEDWPRVTSVVTLIADQPLYFDEGASLSIGDLRARARRHKRARGLDLLIVDHLGLLRGEGRTENRTQEVGTISRGLKRLAKELHIPVIALCQLNRGLESRTDKRPVMADLRESGDIEQDADVVLMVYRDEVYNPDTRDAGCAELILRKNRGGVLTTVPVQWDGKYQRMQNLADGLPSRNDPPPAEFKPRTKIRDQWSC